MELRRSIGDQQSEPPFLLSDTQSIPFNAASHHWVDAVAFESLLATVDTHTAETHEHLESETCPTCMEALRQAVDLYNDPFLAGFSVSDSDLFENWLQTQREHYHRRAVEAFGNLSGYYVNQGDLKMGQQVVRQLLDLAPSREESHSRLMRLLTLSGEQTAALTQYDTFSQILMDELGVSPSAETDALYDQILSGEIGALNSKGEQDSPQHSLSHLPVLEAKAPFQALAPPPHFVGRQSAIDQLRSQMTTPGIQVHAIVGMGGVGKTTLATQLAHAERGDFPDGVL